MNDIMNENRLQALQKLREKLLDLTLRNPLLNFRERGAKVIKIIDELPDQVYKMIVDDGQSMSLLPYEEENTKEVDDQKETTDTEVNETLFEILTTTIDDEVERKAEEEDIVDELPDIDATGDHLFDDRLQTDLNYEKYDGRLRRVYNEYKNLIESTGSNSLYMVLGFVEWHDPSNDPEKPRYAPLILIPIQIERKVEDIIIKDEESRITKLRVFRYHVKHSGEDVTKNLTFQLKLKQMPFNFDLPEFNIDENINPEVYFETLNNMFEQWRSPTSHRWKVKRQIRIGFFSFNKSVMYDDLNPDKWKGKDLVDIPGVRVVLEGQSTVEKDVIPPSEIERVHKEQTIPTIMDADSSQMRVLCRINKGDHVVVQGPPGTGKSQTITNIIAMALSQGKKVLFMAEKLAALQVVRSRLENCGFGPFCLELHSNHASTKEVLNQIKSRLSHFATSPNISLDHILNPLNNAREKLEGHCIVMKKIIIELDITLFELFWKQKASHELLIEQTNLASDILIPIAKENGLPGRNDLNVLSDQMEVIRKHWEDNIHIRGRIWQGYQIKRINQQELSQIESILDQTIRILEEWAIYQKSLDGVGDLSELTSSDIHNLSQKPISSPPDILYSTILHAIGNQLHDASKYRTYLSDMIMVEEHYDSISYHLANSEDLQDDKVTQIVDIVEGILDITETIGSCISETQIQIENFKDCSEMLTKRNIAVNQILAMFEISESFSLLEEQNQFTSQLEYLLSIDTKIIESIDVIHVKANIKRYQLQALDESKELEEIKNSLDVFYSIEDAPDDEELIEFRKDLREVSQSWFSWLPFGRTAKIKREARRFARTGKNVLTHDFIEKLSEITNYRNKVHSFCNDDNFKKNLGNLFKGIDTNWILLKECIETAQNIKSWFQDEQSVSNTIATLSNFEEFKDNIVDQLKIINFTTDEIKNNYPKNDLGSINQIPISKLSARLTNFYKELTKKVEQIKILNLKNDTDYHSIKNITVDIQKIRNSQNRIEEYTSDPTFLNGIHLGVHKTNYQAIEENVDWANLIQTETDYSPILSKWVLNEDQQDRYELLITSLKKLRDYFHNYSKTVSHLSNYGLVEKSIYDSIYGDWLVFDRFLQLKEARNATDILMRWSDYIHSLSWLSQNGYSNLLKFAEEYSINGDCLCTLAEATFYHQWLDEAIQRYPNCMDFIRIEHEQHRDVFVRADKKLPEYYQQSIVNKLTMNQPPDGNARGRVGEYTEMGLINHQINLTRRHCSVRDLINRAYDSLITLMPCWMMGPVSIANFIPSDLIEFDLLIMDEASQIKPEDSLGAMARAKQIVVVGDSNQMPPSNFFSSSKQDDDDESETGSVDLNSILDVCQKYFINERLLWHYRSQHEKLILFSNVQYYDNELIIPPSIYKNHPNLGIEWHYCEGATFRSGLNIIEASMIVQLLIQHIYANANKDKKSFETIGVVAMNSKQRDLIDQMLDKELLKSQELTEAKNNFDNNFRNEPTFIRNLENVQGDERDVIVIGFTYGPSPENNRVYQRFGPITSDGGWRRMNVLFTRARRKIHVFSSMRESDINLPNANQRRGIADMKKYIGFAESGQLHDYGNIDASDPESPFEESVNRFISRLGYKSQFQVGVDGFRIDIGVMNPKDTNTYLCGIECDGAPYHSNPVARDRDRLREEILVDRGWKIFRIWSTEWYRNRKTEEERLEQYLKQLSY